MYFTFPFSIYLRWSFFILHIGLCLKDKKIKLTDRFPTTASNHKTFGVSPFTETFIYEPSFSRYFILQYFREGTECNNCVKNGMNCRA